MLMLIIKTFSTSDGVCCHDLV